MGYFRNVLFENWLPFLDTYRTLCVVPGPQFMGLLREIRSLSVEA